MASSTPDADGRLPLHYAAESAPLSAVCALLDADPSTVDADERFGFTPLMVAAMAGRLEVLDALIVRGARVDRLDVDRHTALHWAVVCAHLDAVKYLLDHGADAEAEDQHGARALHYATADSEATKETTAILHTLLARGVQVDARDVDGRTPLLWAASNGNVEAVLGLINAGAKLDAVDRDGLGVLHCAASNGYQELIRMLAGRLPKTAVDSKDRDGHTPLFYAVSYGQCDAAKALLQLGAVANIQDSHLRTPAHAAASKGQLRMLQTLRSPGGASFAIRDYHGDLPLHEAVQSGAKDVVEWLLTLNASWADASSHEGRRALHIAAATGNLPLVIMLCGHSVSIDALMLRGDKLYTARDLAELRGHSDVVEYLTRRHNAHRAEQLPAEERRLSKVTLERQLEDAQSLGGAGRKRVDLVDEKSSVVRTQSAEANKSRTLRRLIPATKATSTSDLIGKNQRRDAAADPMTVMEGGFTLKDFSVLKHDLEEKVMRVVREQFHQVTITERAETSTVDNNAAAAAAAQKAVDLPKPEEPIVHSQLTTTSAHEDKENGDLRKSEEQLQPEISNHHEVQQQQQQQQQVAEIYEDDWERMADESGGTTASGKEVQRRYIHERAIFHELTHLKKMQIQYGKMQEQVLVRTLIANFCRQHGLNAAHFRFRTFYAWEKFLYGIRGIFAVFLSLVHSTSFIRSTSTALRRRTIEAEASGRRGHRHSHCGKESGVVSFVRLKQGLLYFWAHPGRDEVELRAKKSIDRRRPASVAVLPDNGSSSSSGGSGVKTDEKKRLLREHGSTSVLAGQKRCDCLQKHLFIKQ